MVERIPTDMVRESAQETESAFLSRSRPFLIFSASLAGRLGFFKSAFGRPLKSLQRSFSTVSVQFRRRQVVKTAVQII